ncbi:hypothetical protein ALC57_03037 [Trachymyrmex cornetzi]|uniref:Uncharacterized protein n=1 Tax=Trachymyrmex cornetzi TaxID=471704 RepID=A0A151JMV0_9HYME|nr:hypothetical protein ALC57_03037 [Trachymyrmex cornetzi]
MRTLFTVKHRLNNTANDSERKKAVTVKDTVNVVEGIDTDALKDNHILHMVIPQKIGVNTADGSRWHRKRNYIWDIFVAASHNVCVDNPSKTRGSTCFICFGFQGTCFLGYDLLRFLHLGMIFLYNNKILPRWSLRSAADCALSIAFRLCISIACCLSANSFSTVAREFCKRRSFSSNFRTTTLAASTCVVNVDTCSFNTSFSSLAILFLHILERLSGHFHLIQKCFLFLQPNTILFNVTFPFTVGEVNVRESDIFLLPSPSPTSIVSTSSSAPVSLFIVTPLSSFICTCL